LFNFLKKRLNLEPKYTQLPPRDSDQKFFDADIRAIKNAIGWRPHVGKEQGIMKMIQWLNQSMLEN